ncbi:MAG: hypothetical protein ACREVL_08495 [Solimonas sp.]
MKKFLAIVGAVFLVLLLLGGGFIGYAAWQGRQLDASSKAYVEANIPPIVATWSTERMSALASPQMLEAIQANAQTLERMFHKLSGLGALKSFDDIKGESQTFLNAGQPKVVGATYTANAKFDHGEAKVSIRLIRLGGEWRLQMLNIDSPILAQ